MIITRRHFAGNAALSVSQVIVSGLLLFFLYRYLLKQVGSVQLGLWSVILASTSAARLSDLGMTGGVVKFVASYRAKGDLLFAARTVETTAISIAIIMGAVLFCVRPLFELILAKTIPTASFPLAMKILPLAMFAFWGTSIAGVFQASLDGCQQAGRRNAILTLGNICFFICAIVLVPRYGIVALAWSQIAQSFFLGIACWLVLRRYLKELPLLPFRWSTVLFKQMFLYSANFQINSVATMLCDPLTKILMSRFGGLSATAYYEMAGQMVSKVRALMVSANQVIVPVVAEAHESSPNMVRDIYNRSYSIVFFIAVPVYSALMLTVPMVSQIWIGRIENQFIAFACLLVVVNFVNNLGVPAYFDNLGTGKLAWNTFAHLLMALLNAALGSALGYGFGAFGVAIGAALAILSGSLLVTFAVQRQYNIAFTEMVPKAHRSVAVVTATVGFSGLMAVNYAHANGIGVFAATTCAATCFILAYVAVTRRHSYRYVVEGTIRRYFRAHAHAER